MKNLTTSLYAIANDNFEGYVTKGKEYPVFKILEQKWGRRIVIINDKGVMEDWGAELFTFTTR